MLLAVDNVVSLSNNIKEGFEQKLSISEGGADDIFDDNGKVVVPTEPRIEVIEIPTTLDGT